MNIIGVHFQIRPLKVERNPTKKNKMKFIQFLVFGFLLGAVFAARGPRKLLPKKPKDEEPKEERSNELISFKEFKNTLKFNNYPESTKEQYDTVLKLAKKFGIDTKEEMAMFLAQVYWESLGLQHTKEIICEKSQCPEHYRTGREKPGKYYYGRGYIQLTWLDNYSNCSKDLYGDDRLVENPDLVSDTAEGAWGSAFWYWSKYVHPIPHIKKGEFGHSTMAINGPLECKGPFKIKAFRRFTRYIKVLEALGLEKKVNAQQDGCYPMVGADAPGFKLCRPTPAQSKLVGMFHWCNDNCNQDLTQPDTCPESTCICEKSKKQLLDELLNKDNNDKPAAAVASTTDDNNNKKVDSAPESKTEFVDKKVTLKDILKYKAQTKDTQKDSMKETMKEPMKEPMKESMKEPMKESMKEPMKETTKEPMKEPMKESMKEPMKETTKEPMKEPMKESMKEPMKESMKEPMKETTKESMKETMKESMKEPEKETRTGSDLSPPKQFKSRRAQF